MLYGKKYLKAFLLPIWSTSIDTHKKAPLEVRRCVPRRMLGELWHSLPKEIWPVPSLLLGDILKNSLILSTLIVNHLQKRVYSATVMKFVFNTSSLVCILLCF